MRFSIENDFKEEEKIKCLKLSKYVSYIHKNHISKKLILIE